MALTIYGIPKSRAFRVYWAAEELGLAYQSVPVDFTEGVKQPEFLKINPNGKIPAIDDNGFVLTESLAITLYLAKRHGKASLYPASAEDEARTLQWSLWGVSEVEKPLIDLVSNRFVRPPEKRDLAVAEDAERKLARPMGVLESHLASRQWILGGGGFTIADLNVASLLYTAWFNKLDLGRWPRIKDWLDRCFTRPAALRARKLREG